MAKSFEEMAMWKRSRELVKFIYQITKNKPCRSGRTFFVKPDAFSVEF